MTGTIFGAVSASPWAYLLTANLLLVFGLAMLDVVSVSAPRRALAWAVVVGALLWSAVQARWVWTRQLYYVPPPAPPREDSTESAQVPVADPERPAPRG